MYRVPDTAWKFGCGRYIQKANAMLDLPKEIERLKATKAMVLAGNQAWDAVCSIYPKQEFLQGVSHCLRLHSDPCSLAAAEEYARQMLEEQCDIVIGIGGGKIMDLAKLTAQEAGMPILNVPTICATCAAFTPLSVIYTPEGKALGSWFFDWEVNGILADTTVLSRQPFRYAFSGIADSMAKIVEIEHKLSFAPTRIDLSFAQLNARYLFDRLMQLSDNVAAALEKKEPSPLIDELIYLTIPATGVISGFARGQGQSALAHGLYESVRTLYTKASADDLHGEIVGVGMRLQLAFDGKNLSSLDAAMKKLYLPMHLRDIHAEENEDAYKAIAKELVGMDLLTQFSDGEERVVNALKMIEKEYV